MRAFRLLPHLGPAFLLLASVAAAPAAAAPPILVRDFAPGEHLAGPSPRGLAPFGNLLAMAGEDPVHGQEPWLWDGAGARRLADLLPGPAGSNPRLFTAVGSRLAFVADDGGGRHLIYGYEPSPLNRGVWALAEVDGYPIAAAVLGGHAYFFADDYRDSRLVIYQSDGAPGSTTEVASLCPAPFVCHSDPVPVFAFGGSIYFSFVHGLWRFTPGLEPALVREIGRATDYVPLDGSRFVMRACDPVCHLWVSDGSSAGTFQLDPPGGTLTEEARDLTVFRGLVYAVNGAGKVIVTNGNVAGTTIAAGFPIGPSVRLLGSTVDALFYTNQNQVSPFELRAVTSPGGSHELLAQASGSFARGGVFGNRMVLYSSDSVVWRSNGTAAGTEPVGNLLGVESGVELGGNFYFPALANFADGNGYRALYRLGLLAHAHLAAGPEEWPLGSFPQAFAAAGGIAGAALDQGILRLADSSENYGLYRVDPASLAAARADFGSYLPLAVAGEKLFAATQPGAGQLVALSATAVGELGPANIASPAATADGRLLFNDAGPGQKLWSSDGTFEGTGPLLDLAPGWTPPVCITFPCPDEQLPASITAVGDQVFFLADSRPEVAGPELWVLPPMPGAPRRLADLPPVEPLPRLATLAGGRVAYAVPDLSTPEYRTRFWVSDGTEAGTFNFLTLAGLLPDPELAGLGAKLLINWKTGGNLIVADPGGVASFILEADQIGRFTVVGDLAFFRAGRPDTGAELWRTDGTPGGTFPIHLKHGIDSALAPDVEIFPIGDGRVAFAADDRVTGNEPWISDGGFYGTTRLADLASGPAASNPRKYASAGGLLFFQADDGESGAELWAIDLPAGKAPCPADRLCLLQGRFEVQVQAIGGGQVFQGRRAMASDETGIFTFFVPDNWELMVKVLDACHLNQRFWVYAAGATDVDFELKVQDHWSGTLRTYHRPAGTPAAPIIDQDAFATCGIADRDPPYRPGLPIPPLVNRCADDPRTLCLGEEGRFRVRASWQTRQDQGPAQPLPYGSRDSGVFWFYNAPNWELVVKVLDGCALNGHHWVYAAGTTDSGWKLEVEDRTTGERRVYQNPVGQPSITVTDSLALGGCP